MSATVLKNTAGSLKKLWAALSVATLSALIVLAGNTASATITNGIVADIYSNYTASTSYRPMDNPSVVSSYGTLCKTTTLNNVNFTGGSFDGCGADYILVHYKGYVYSSTAQTLWFRGYSDDGIWFKVGGTVVVNNWDLRGTPGWGCSYCGTGQGVTFEAGEFKAIDGWFFEHGGGESSTLSFATNSSFTNEQVVPNSMLTTNSYVAAKFTDESVVTQVVEGGLYSDAVSATASTGISGFSIQSGSLPPGLNLNGVTGAISGTATEFGTYNFQIRTTAVDGTVDDTAPLTITVGTNTSLLTSLADQTLWIGEEFSDRAIFGGYPAPTVTRTSGSLPPGLTLGNDGTLSGSPTTAGTFSAKLRGTNFVDYTETELFTFSVEPPPVFTGNPNFSKSVEYGGAVSVLPTVTGNAVQFSLEGALPAGLTLDVETGALTGNATEAGTFNFRVLATNPSGSTYSTASTIVVNRSPVFTESSVAPELSRSDGENNNYSFTFEANGYPTPTFEVVSGQLPSGLTLSSQGVLSGRPITGGDFTFTIRAMNSYDSPDDEDSLAELHTTTVTKTISVIQLPTAVDVSILQSILAGSRYLDGIEYSGFPVPTYSIAEGSLPPGISLDQVTGALVGTPTVGGLYNFKIRATGGTNSATTDSLQLTINQAPQKLDDVISPKTELGKPYSDAITTTGYPNPTYSLKSGNLPPGIKLNPESGAITGTTSSPGIFAFVVEASNSVGSWLTSKEIAVQQTPSLQRTDFPTSLNVGDLVSVRFGATGFPAPTFAITSGALPEGLTLNPVTGEVSGTITNGGKYSFVVSALNEVGSTAHKSLTVEVIGADTQITLAAAVGDVVTGKTISIAGGGLKAVAPYNVVLRSTPQTIASGKTSAQGTVEQNAKLPAGLEPGWHSITMSTLKADGTPFEKVIYFQITESLMLEEISPVEPSESQKQEALINDPEFYAKMGIDPAGTVTPAAAAAQVEQVTSVVASVALVSAAAAGAAAAASAAGGAASSAGGSSSSSSGGRSSGGSTSSSSSSSSGGSNSDSNSEETEGGDYGNLEADHDDFETEGAGLVDRLEVWKLGFMTAIDKPLTKWIERSAQISPVLSRILNDGSYLRALVGSFMVAAYLAAVVLGIAAVDPSANTMATSGRIGLLVAIMAIGTLDALFGIVAMSAFVFTSLVTLPTNGIGDIRYLLAMFILGFAPSIMATTFRKIRRPAIENLNDAWERVIDLALIGFISVLTVMSLVGSVSAFAGATVPLSADVKPIALAIASVAVLRVVIEEGAAKFAPNRLDRLNPTEVPGTFVWQPWASLALKATVLILMIGGMVGMGWHLWVGTFLIFLPGIIGLVFPELPSFKWIHEFIPGGVGALAFATLISSWSGQIVNALLGKSELYGQLSFILIPLPVILIAIIGMFAKQEEKLWQRTNQKWLYIAGGIAVFVFTIQVTEFFPTIFG